MAAEKRYKSFWEFYPYYLTEHSDIKNRTLHFIGTALVIVLFFRFIVTFNWTYFVLIPVAGYGFAWFGHLIFEKNKPATFEYPLWSLGSDFVMFFHILTGQVKRQIQLAKEQLERDANQKPE